MKTRTKVYKKTGLTAAIIILICMIIIMAQSPAKAQKIRKSTDLEYHERLQKAYNWNVSRSNWLKNDLKTAKKNKKLRKNRKKEAIRKERILAKIERIKND
ncbi:MAG TPA: hypothetical protein VIH28_08350 [Ignavibacteriaceae bacterium]